MKSLQSMSTEYILEQLPSDKQTQKSVVEYLSKNPTIVQQYLDSYKMYSVYFREQDPATLLKPVSNDIHLLKVFVTLQYAQEWVLRIGYNIIADHKENYQRPLVLTIIPVDNRGVYYYDDVLTNMHLISTKRYLTYAFTKEDYEMLLCEHKSMVLDNSQDDIIPYWINYYDGHNITTFNMNDLEDLFKNLRYYENDAETKDKLRQEMILFQENPVMYICSKTVHY